MVRPRSRSADILRGVADVIESVERGEVTIRLPFEGPVLELTREAITKVMRLDDLLEEALSRGAGGSVRTPRKSSSVNAAPMPKRKRRTIQVEARVVSSTPPNSAQGGRKR